MSVEAIKADLTAATARDEADAIFKSAYAAGYTLQEIADLVGLTREAIRLRLSKPVPVSMLREYSPSIRAVARQERDAERRFRGKRLLGIRVSAPVMQVPVAPLNRISELSELVTTVRGWTPLDAPARLAIPEFGELLWRTLQDFEVPINQLELVSGKAVGTYRAWLRNHGYFKQSPSQKSYRGVVIDRTDRRNHAALRLVPGGTCRKGHSLSETDIVDNGGNGNKTCRICRAERYALRYQSRKAVA